MDANSHAVHAAAVTQPWGLFVHLETQKDFLLCDFCAALAGLELIGRLG